MSGGEYGYFYLKVKEFAEAILEPYKAKNTDSMNTIGKGFERGNIELRLAFADHLEDIAEIMRVIELCDSGDVGEKAVEEAILNVFGDDNIEIEE